MQPNSIRETGAGQPANRPVQWRESNDREQGFIHTACSTLVFVKQGALNWIHGQEEYQVNKDEMLFLKRNILVSYQADATAGGAGKVKYILIHLDYDLIRDFMKMTALRLPAGSQNESVMVDTPGKQLLQYMNSLECYLGEDIGGNDSFTRLKLMELLFCLSNFNAGIMHQLLHDQPGSTSSITATVEANLTNPLSMRQLATLSGRSLSGFRREFQAMYNMSPSQWIRQRRLEKARELLTTTPLSVTDICYTLGFESMPHFSRLFKASYQVCPSKFRVTCQVVQNVPS